MFIYASWGKDAGLGVRAGEPLTTPSSAEVEDLQVRVGDPSSLGVWVGETSDFGIRVGEPSV